MQPVERQPPLGERHGLGGSPGRGQRGDQPVEGELQLGPQLRRGGPLPVVEDDAVAQAEPGQEVVAVQGDGARQRLDRPPPLPGRRGQRAEPADVHRVVVDVQPSGGAVDHEEPPTQRGAQRGERAAQRRPPAVAAGVRPEQVGDQLAAVHAAADGQVGQHRRRLARVDRQRRTVHLDPRRPQELDRQRHPPRVCQTIVTIAALFTIAVTPTRNHLGTPGARNLQHDGSRRVPTLTQAARLCRHLVPSRNDPGTADPVQRRCNDDHRPQPPPRPAPRPHGARRRGVRRGAGPRPAREGRAGADRDRAQRPDHRVLPERAGRGRHRRPRAGVARAARSCARPASSWSCRWSRRAS